MFPKQEQQNKQMLGRWLGLISKTKSEVDSTYQSTVAQ